MSFDSASLRIALNGRFLTRSVSGVERVAAELARQLSTSFPDGESENTPSLCAISPKGKVSSIEDELFFPVEQKGIMNGHAWEQLELPFFVKDQWLLSPCNIGPLAVSRQVVIIHDAQVFLTPQAYSFAFRNWYQRLLPILGRRAEIVITVSEYSKTQLEHFGVVPPGKAIVIHNGGDHINRVERSDAILDKYNLKPKQFFLAVGSRSSHKNLQILAKATPLRKSREFPLVIAGGSDSRVFATDSTSDTEEFLRVGKVTDEELKSLYSNATALLFPSIYEGFGLPPIEAMYCKCAVIASNAASIPEVCGDAAIFVDPHDAAGWAAAMDRIAEDNGDRQRLAEAGFEHCAQFSWKNCATSILAAIREHS